MGSKELTIIVPVYNEQEVIEKVIDKWSKQLSSLNINFEIKAFNDGSRDNTLEMLNKAKGTCPNLMVIDKPNSGHGPTILKGYKESLDSEWLFQMDSDDEIAPDYFSELWNNRKKFDFLIGNRKNRNTPKVRQLISWISRFTIRVFYGSKVFDVNCPYRLMNSNMVKDFIQTIPDDTLAPNLIIAGMASKKKLKVFQKIVKFEVRTTGEVSIKNWKLFKFSVKSFLQTISFRLKFA